MVMKVERSEIAEAQGIMISRHIDLEDRPIGE